MPVFVTRLSNSGHTNSFFLCEITIRQTDSSGQPSQTPCHPPAIPLAIPLPSPCHPPCHPPHSSARFPRVLSNDLVKGPTLITLEARLEGTLRELKSSRPSIGLPRGIAQPPRPQEPTASARLYACVRPKTNTIGC